MVNVWDCGKKSGEAIYPQAERVTNAKLENDIVELLEGKECQGDNGPYYAVLAEHFVTDKAGKQLSHGMVSFGTGKVQTTQIKEYLAAGGKWPMGKVKIGSGKSPKGRFFRFDQP